MTLLAAADADFALRDGDTVVFLGDSITAARTYGKIIENYTLLRFPERKIRFVNAGRGGDTAAGGMARLAKDVFPHGPTVLIVAYGVNDIGWGMKADDAHKKTYLDGVRGIVEQCRQRKVRVFLCSAAVTAEDPAKSESGFLQKMCDEGTALARSLGEQSIDVQRSMRTIQGRMKAANDRRKKDDRAKATLHAADGVHLNDVGQLAMAFSILKGLNAPADVSLAHLDARDGRVLKAAGCNVSDVALVDGGLEFTRLDDGLPFNYGTFFPLNYQYVPVPDELARYLLRIDGLPNGKHQVTADGRGLGSFSSDQLAKGINLQFATEDAWQPGGPWDAQAAMLKGMTDARHELAVAAMLGRAYLSADGLPKEAALDFAKIDEQLVALQRRTARPRPYRFVIRPVRETKSKR
jgi:lysophospholipase L1-like esterase